VRVSVASIAWSAASCAGGITIGVMTGSLVLVAMGVTSALDGLGSAALIAHFRHSLRHQEFSEAHERLALRVVTIGLVVVGLSTVGESTHRLLEGAHPTPVVGGIVLAATSAVVLGGLAVRKRALGSRLASRALVADGIVSATGSLLGLVTVAGVGLDYTLGWSWADPVAATALGVLAAGGGVAMWRA
jgi:divalent metal cation (Fe/Co/Zn/Cd) transporter